MEELPLVPLEGSSLASPSVSDANALGDINDMLDMIGARKAMRTASKATVATPKKKALAEGATTGESASAVKCSRSRKKAAANVKAAAELKAAKLKRKSAGKPAAWDKSKIVGEALGKEQKNGDQVAGIDVPKGDGHIALGCSKCRWSKGGCAQCRSPDFKGKRGSRVA
jgi:hypothetical protein